MRNDNLFFFIKITRNGTNHFYESKRAIVFRSFLAGNLYFVYNCSGEQIASNGEVLNSYGGFEYPSLTMKNKFL